MRAMALALIAPPPCVQMEAPERAMPVLAATLPPFCFHWEAVLSAMALAVTLPVFCVQSEEPSRAMALALIGPPSCAQVEAPDKAMPPVAIFPRVAAVETPERDIPPVMFSVPPALWPKDDPAVRAREAAEACPVRARVLLESAMESVTASAPVPV